MKMRRGLTVRMVVAGTVLVVVVGTAFAFLLLAVAQLRRSARLTTSISGTRPPAFLPRTRPAAAPVGHGGHHGRARRHARAGQPPVPVGDGHGQVAVADPPVLRTSAK